MTKLVYKKRKIKLYGKYYTITNRTFTQIDGGGYTDEGFDFWQEEYYIGDDGRIVREYQRHASDCDGPLDQYSTAWCNPPTRKNDYVPSRWYTTQSSQRDHFAEAAGY